MSSLQDSVKSIFDHMEIKRIYHIDDHYETDYITSVLAQFSSIPTEIFEKVFEKFGEIYVENNDIDKDTLKDIWNDIEGPDKKEILMHINTNFSWDIKASETIENICTLVELNKLGPNEWEEQKDTITQGLSQGKTLFLFDNDWGIDLVGEGIKVIKELTSNEELDQNNIICGLFTHTVSPEEEFLKRDTLSREEDVRLDRFLVISKQHEIGTFFKSLRTTAIMPTLKTFKEKIHKHIIDSSNIVDSYITEELDILDLEYITLDKAFKEGEWEPKVLYRLHNNRHIKAFREKIFSDETIQVDIECMRNLKNLSSEISLSPTEKTKEIMKYELYDKNINDYNCPIKSGDIFKTSTGKKFILLMQPCEIILRSNGERTNPEYKTFANLVEISNRQSSCPIKYFEDETYYLQLTKVKKVELDILDLCSYSNEGKCQINLQVNNYEHKLEGLKLRYSTLHKKYQKLHQLWDTASRNPDLKKHLFMPYGKGILAITIPNLPADQVISFGLTRINRVAKEVAQNLHVNLLSHLSRSAMESDLAQ